MNRIKKRHNLNGRKTAHENKSKKIICNICTKTCQTQSNLNMHVKTIHGGQNNFKCGTCDNSFAQAGSMKRHMNISADLSEIVLAANFRSLQCPATL